MSKSAKFLVILMIFVIGAYVTCGVYKKIQVELENSLISSGDINLSGDSLKYEDKIVYELSSGDNFIALKGKSEGSISTTIYNFENNKLNSIVLTEEIISGDDVLVEKIYNHMKTSEEMSEAYSSVEKNNNIITAFLKQEYVDAYEEDGLKEIYYDLEKSLEITK